METAFLHGFCLALGLILPLGAQNLFILQQGIVQPSFAAALPSIAAASAADTILICLAVSGISLIILAVPLLKNVLIIGGAAFLLYLAFVTWRTADTPLTSENSASLLSARQQIGFALSVSILNPFAILDTIGVIGTSSLSYSGQEKLAFTIATILVSWLWFTALSRFGHFIATHPNRLISPARISRISSVVICFSALTLLKGL